MELDLEQVVTVPAGRVFAILSDPVMRPRWQEKTSDVRDLTPGPVGVGTRWTETTRGVGDVRMEVAALEPGVLWEEAGSAHGGHGLVSVRLRSEGEESTHLAIHVELRLSGLRRVMEPAVGKIVAHQMPGDLRRLEALLSA